MKRLQMIGTDLVICGIFLGLMNWAINFNYNFEGMAIKIHYVASNRMLSPESDAQLFS